MTSAIGGTAAGAHDRKRHFASMTTGTDRTDQSYSAFAAAVLGQSPHWQAGSNPYAPSVGHLSGVSAHAIEGQSEAVPVGIHPYTRCQGHL